ncbi:uncharacterized protein LOC132800138 [Ziziphus jujuba]|uniref:Uncharacterized protein LOC132800138 n=1 Tax=Ziziphus jujuba TaxID=326968 RepID=A0ABM3ZXB1_ZIZJJ|nr:uncharacterized protein LOC132800138 [Ziziphus jujuba]
MPKKFWAEALYTSSYIQNRCFTKSIEGKTPYELWFGENPSLENVKVFGNVFFFHVHSHMRDKLDKKANVGVLVGYSEVTKGFRVYNLKTKKLMVTRDVKINENAKWDWNNKEDDDLFQEIIGVDLEVGDGVRGERSLSEIYERCNVALGDLTCVQEALMKKEWKEVRLVVKGYAQQAGVDYGEMFAPVVRMETIRLILDLLATKQWSVFHLDVKSAFLNGALQEEVYVKQPEGYVIEGHEDKVKSFTKPYWS